MYVGYNEMVDYAIHPDILAYVQWHARNVFVKQERFAHFVVWDKRRNTKLSRSRITRACRGSRILTGNVWGENFMMDRGTYPARTNNARCI